MTVEKTYVTYTCKNKNCRKAFIDLDPNNDINEEPLKNRFCPDCVKKGFKNPQLKPKSSKQIKESEDKIFILEKIKAYNIVDKKDINFILKYCKKNIERKNQNGLYVNRLNIFKEALEVLSYQNWKS